MIVLIVFANELPAAVRGRMKLWFIEPRPNVFVSGVKDSVAIEVLEYLHTYCPLDSGILLARTIPEPPGFEIRTIGSPRKAMIEISGLQLIVESKTHY